MTLAKRLNHQNNIHKRFFIYLFIFFVGYIFYFLLRGFNWVQNLDFHTLTEIIGAFLALFVSVLAYVRYFTRKNNMFLFISTGFLVEGTFKGIHAIVTSRFFDHLVFSPPIITWTCLVSRIVFPSLLLLSFLTEKRTRFFVNINNKLLYGSLFLILGTSLFIIMTLYPSVNFVDHLTFISKDLLTYNSRISFFNDIPIIFYLFTIFSYIKKGNWKEESFEHWLIISLLFGLLSELIFVLSTISADIIFSHIYKNVSYLVLFIGLLLNMSRIFKQAARTSREIKEMNYSLKCQIKEREKLQKGLKESEERYRLLVEHSPDMIAVNSNQKWKYINTVGRKMLGAGCKNDLIGQDIFQFIVPEERDLVKKTIEMLHKTRDLERFFERKFVTLNGQIIDVEVQAITTKYDGEPAILILARDITERKKTEELLRRSEKLSVVGELAAGIAHEIRNPLTSINGFIQLIQRNGNNKEQFYNIMLSELSRIETIISELLVLAKPHSTNKQKCHIGLLIDHVVTLVGPQANSLNIEIVKEIKTELSLISCEGNQLKQVFINIIKNSIEAMPVGGKINIKIEGFEDQLLISFKDQGLGIPREILEKIGQPFFTTKEKGTGLGLMISKKIIQEHHGLLKIENNLEKGTTVKITLPIV